MESADRLGLLLLGCLMALPLLPEFMVGYVLIAWFTWRLHKRNLKEAFIHIPRSFLLILPYFIWYFWRWSASDWNVDGGRILAMHLQWVLFPILLYGLHQDLLGAFQKLVHWLWVLVVLTAIALTVEGGIEWTLRDTPILGFSDHPLFYIGLSDPLMHPGYLSMIVAVFMVVATAVPRPPWLTKWRFLIGQLFLLTFIVMLSSRMIMAALLLTWPLTGFFQSLFNRKGLRATGFLVLLLALIFGLGLLPEPIDSRIRELSRIEYQINAQNLEDFSGVTIRLAEWKGALLAIKNEPLLGHGPGLGHYALMNAYDKLGFQVGRRFEFNAHNQYLQTALDLGWPGTLLIILSVLAIAYPYGSTRNRLVLWFLVFFLLSSITESTLLRQRGAVMLALYLPLFGFIAPKKVGDQA